MHARGRLPQNGERGDRPAGVSGARRTTLVSSLRSLNVVLDAYGGLEQLVGHGVHVVAVAEERLAHVLMELSRAQHPTVAQHVPQLVDDHLVHVAGELAGPHILSYLILSYLILSYLILSYLSYLIPPLPNPLSQTAHSRYTGLQD